MAVAPGAMDHGGDVPAVSQSRYQIPDWLSPARLIALSAPQTRSVVIPGGVETTLAKRNPTRVGLVVIIPSGSALEFRISPVRGLGLNGIALANNFNYFTATLSDWLSLVCEEWYAVCASGTTVSVTEMVRTF